MQIMLSVTFKISIHSTVIVFIFHVYFLPLSSSLPALLFAFAEWFAEHSLSFSTHRLKSIRRHNSRASRFAIDFGTDRILCGPDATANGV